VVVLQFIIVSKNIHSKLLKHLAFPRNQIFKSKLDGMMVMTNSQGHVLSPIGLNLSHCILFAFFALCSSFIFIGFLKNSCLYYIILPVPVPVLLLLLLPFQFHLPNPRDTGYLTLAYG